MRLVWSIFCGIFCTAVLSLVWHHVKTGAELARVSRSLEAGEEVYRARSGAPVALFDGFQDDGLVFLAADEEDLARLLDLKLSQGGEEGRKQVLGALEWWARGGDRARFELAATAVIILCDPEVAARELVRVAKGEAHTWLETAIDSALDPTGKTPFGQITPESRARFLDRYRAR